MSKWESGGGFNGSTSFISGTQGCCGRCPGTWQGKPSTFFTAHIPDNLVQVTMDLAFGGMWFAIVAADQVAYKLGKTQI